MVAERPTRRTARGEVLEPGKGEAEQVAALLAGEGVDFVDHDGLEILEQQGAVGVGEQQAEAFGRGQQDVRRADSLAGLAIGRRIAASGLDADRQSHLLDRGHEIALDVDRQRLQRRDVERVEAVARIIDQVGKGRQETGQRLAGAGRGDQQDVVTVPRGVEHRQLVPPRRPAATGEPLLDLVGERDLSQSSLSGWFLRSASASA